MAVPTSDAHAEQHRRTPAEDQTRPGHEDLRLAAESALRMARVLGEVGFMAASGGAVASTDRAIAIGARTAKTVARWILI